MIEILKRKLEQVNKSIIQNEFAGLATKYKLMGQKEMLEQMIESINLISPECDMHDVGQSFGCDFQFCNAVIDKHNNVKCDKCKKYIKNIAP